MRQANERTAPLPGWRRGLVAGLLTGALIGIVAALLSVPLRRLAGVTDRSLVNGLSITSGAIVLWLIGGLVYVALTRRAHSPMMVLLALSLLCGVVISAFIYGEKGPLAPFPNHFASCAVPLVFLVTLGGALLLLSIIDRPMPLNFAAPAGVVAAAAIAIVISAADRAPAVHYSLSKLPVSAAAQNSAPAATATQSGSAPAVVSAAPQASPATPAPAATAPTHFVVSKESEVSYTVREKLARLPSPSDAVGKTSAITGDLYLSPTGLAPEQPSLFTVNLSTLTSDATARDRFIKTTTLETNKFPNAIYTITGVDGFPASYKEGDEVKLTLTGTLKVHDVERPLTWTGTARYAGGRLEGVMATDFSMHDFNITPPVVAVAVAEDKVHLDLHLVAMPAS